MNIGFLDTPSMTSPKFFAFFDPPPPLTLSRAIHATKSCHSGVLAIDEVGPPGAGTKLHVHAIQEL